MRKKRGLIFILSGPSGSGKTTLASRILEEPALKGKIARSISFTTRPKRTGERDKKDYFFISEEQFRASRKAKKILEWTKYIGYYYATPREQVEKQLKKGKGVILCLDVKGAFAVRRLYPKDTVTIFVMPPFLKELRKRIIGRSHNTRQDEIKQRLQLARKEMRKARKYDYCLVNKDLFKAAAGLKKIILAKLNQR